MPDYPDLLRTLTLGTARSELSPEVTDWLTERDAVDPTSDDGERLLAAWAITERLQRLEAGPTVVASSFKQAPEDERALPSPKLNRGIQLVMQGTYPQLLPEVLRLLIENDIQFPPFLLPSLLEQAVARFDDQPDLVMSMIRAAGPRGTWLAGLNPEWQLLAPDYSPANSWTTNKTPGARLTLLKRWRRSDPAAVRDALDEIWDDQSPKNQEALLAAFSVNLNPEDLPWLRAKTGPKRRGVRRSIFTLLLQGGEQQALDDAITLAAASVDENGKPANLLNTEEASELLNKYGGLRKKESLTAFLLDVLPPHVLPDLIGKTSLEFWSSLRKDELTIAANTLLRYYSAPDIRAEFVRFACLVNPAQLPLEQAAQLTAELSQEDFIDIFHRLLDKEKNVLHSGGVPRILILSRTEPWSERITKAFLLQLTLLLKDVYNLPHTTLRDLQAHWKLSIPLVHRSSFGWLRTQLHSMTERSDTFGKLATEMLQTTAFRRALWEEKG